MQTLQNSSLQTSLPLKSGVQDGPAKMSVREMPSERVSTEKEADSSTIWLRFLKSVSRCGLSWKMCQGYSRRTKAPHLKGLSSASKSWGIWGDGLRLTLPTRAYPKTATASSLSEVLDQTVPITSLLTAANCLGTLRRAIKNRHPLDRKFAMALGQTLRLWYNVAAASGTPWQRACAPRYVPKLDHIKAVIQTGQYSVARNLTWDECDKLMGFPPGWTVAEGDSLVTPSALQSQNGSHAE